MMDGIATICSDLHMAPVRHMTIHLVTNETSLAHHLKEIACQQFGQKFEVSSEKLQNANRCVRSENAPEHLKVTIKYDSELSVCHKKPPSNHLHGSKRGQESQTETCPVCLDTPVDPTAFNDCGHILCRDCMEFIMKNKPVCPVCGKIYGILRGSQPTGTMEVRTIANSLPGFRSCGTIDILYRFPNGIQTEGHSNPGKPYHGTSKRAFLPDNAEGRKVMSLLKKAFERRLVFTIGRSVTTGAENTVTWNDIHHKTNRDGGPQNYGYPDADYFRRVKEELAAKGVTEDT
ncbi:hypothetical protein CHS0354_016677 [Potamilus streckersoni]|uniref:E3 ubiquitin-protein ligase n=1 Tax=Potamilus streckersoni TaxID=2493646 RepID=A0AAE0TI99_9BIVA|nr:hypothetical protein CHS0354_016677 [Potamilus streckersoni]